MDKDLILELPTDLQSIEDAVDYVVARCDACERAASRLRFNFRVGLTEALSNAMLYGNGHDPSKRVMVEVRINKVMVTARVTDQGVGFDPALVPDPTTPDHLSDVGGRGLFLMKKLLDEVSFNDRGNSVTLVLRLDGDGVLEGGAQA
ncbi:MAG: ATP-binding protein [Gemmatimonadota bacterium]|nr:ATP-binding protein [Gemmatimonadota bacterium]MDH5759351.1 ATP-binding protein [Gemmatimonadota bacterium]